MNAQEIKSDTLTLLLCNQVHKNLDDKSRSIKIAKCCKVIRDRAIKGRTKDNVLYEVCRSFINENSSGKYSIVLKKLNKMQKKYYREYKK